MMTTLTIEEIALSIKTGKTPPTRDKLNFENGEYNWFTPGDFKVPKILTKSKRKITDYAVNNSAVIYEKDTILITCIGDIGNTGIIKAESSANQQITGVIVNPDIIHPEFFLYWVKANKHRIQNEANQAVVPILNNKGLKRIKVTFPSDLPTQNKIVSLLDKASALVQKREESIDLLEKLINDKFYFLFADSFLNQKSFKEYSIDSLCEKIVDCPHSTPKYTNTVTEYPCIRTSEIKNGEIDWSSMKYLNVESHIERTSRLEPKENDLVFGREGTVGEIAIVPSKLKLSLGQRVMLFRVNKDLVTPFYFWAALRSNGIQHKIHRKTIGATVKRINIKAIKLIKIPLPDLVLQNRFDFFYHKIQIQKKALLLTKIELENLYNSLLQRAFNGQLNFNEDGELDALLAAIDIEKEENDIRDIATVHASRLIERIETQRFDTMQQYKQAKHVLAQLLKNGNVAQHFDGEHVKLKLV